MSGIVGYINHDGVPADAALLNELMGYLAFRGPDGRGTWIQGSTALGHALLVTTAESAREKSPLTLDGQIAITADVRLDDRPALLDQLRAKGQSAPAGDACDSELLLRSYLAWGDACVEHLQGDFSFAVWDGPRRRLFAARDQFGVKPFFYAPLARCFLFSNTLNAIRRCSIFPRDLDDLVVADFLLFGWPLDLDTTIFARARRLPPAHTLVWHEGKTSVQRYWDLPTDPPIRYRRDRDYVEHFLHHFQQAVQDRLRIGRAGILMSGGLDSTSVAAVARKLCQHQGKPIELRSFTHDFRRIMKHEEPPWAERAAQHLGIPATIMEFDRVDYLPELEEVPGGQVPPEPYCLPVFRARPRFHQAMARHAPVYLTGYGGDALFRAPSDHFLKLLKGLRLDRFVWDSVRCYQYGSRPPWALRGRLKKRLFGENGKHHGFPAWMSQNLVERLDLRSRWNRYYQPRVFAEHPVRKEARHFLQGRLWPFVFEMHEPGCTLTPAESGHPFFDLRLVRYLLAIPPLPWCSDKGILRHGMEGLLPDPIRFRPKKPLGPTPLPFARRLGLGPRPRARASLDCLKKHVELDRVPDILSSSWTWSGEDEFLLGHRPLGLAAWLNVS